MNKRVTTTEEDENIVNLGFECVDIQGRKKFSFTKTSTDQPELDKAEPLYISAECDGRDISMFLTRKEAALLRDFIEAILNDTE